MTAIGIGIAVVAFGLAICFPLWSIAGSLLRLVAHHEKFAAPQPPSAAE